MTIVHILALPSYSTTGVFTAQFTAQSTAQSFHIYCGIWEKMSLGIIFIVLIFFSHYLEAVAE